MTIDFVKLNYINKSHYFNSQNINVKLYIRDTNCISMLMSYLLYTIFLLINMNSASTTLLFPKNIVTSLNWMYDMQHI